MAGALLASAPPLLAASDEGEFVTPPVITPTPSPTPTAPPSPTPPPLPATDGLRMEKVRTITATPESGGLSPKSVVASGTGFVYAQNMIYNHSITVYDSTGRFVKRIADAVELAAFGITGYPAGTVKGGPVELAFSPDGTKAYASNYSMFGPGFRGEGSDKCNPNDGTPNSFVYRIDVASHEIDQVIEVGAVPKYVATTPDGRYVLVTNWCTYDLSVISTELGREITRVTLGAYPRGIVVSPDSGIAYVAVMGSRYVKSIDLQTFEATTFAEVGASPRHIVRSPDGRYLYVTLNGEGRIAKVDSTTGEVLKKVATGQAPRSMDISLDGASLYVVNYESSTVSKVRTRDMEEVQELRTGYHPIGITYDTATGRIWVATYGGTLEVFAEFADEI